MTKMMMTALHAGILAALVLGTAGCNRNADAGIAGAAGAASTAAPEVAPTTQAAAQAPAAQAEPKVAKATPAASGPKYAKVTSVTPVRESSQVPKQVCHDEVVAQTAPPKDEHQLIGTAIGAVAGGLLGNQVGGGKGKTLATVAGAVGGGIAGNRIEASRQRAKQTSDVKQVCETVQADGPSQIVGYDVSYVYNGVTRTVRMDHDPGDRVEIQENVSAVPVAQ